MRHRFIAILAVCSMWLPGLAVRSEELHGFPSSLSGKVVIHSLDEHNLVVAVDSNEEAEPDGVADFRFFYTAKDSLGEPVSLEIPFANVEFRPGLLRVSSPDKGRILLLRVRSGPLASPQVATRDLERPADEARRSLWRVYDDEGLGLAAYHGANWSMADLAGPGSLEAARAAVAVPAISVDDPGGSGGGGGGCKSGGRGALTCSVGCGSDPCSTTCGAGFYACCNCSNGASSCVCRF